MNWESMTWKERMVKRTEIVFWAQYAQYAILGFALGVFILELTGVYSAKSSLQSLFFLVSMVAIVVIGAIKRYHQAIIDFDRKDKVSELLDIFSKIPVGTNKIIEELDEQTEVVFLGRLVEICEFAGIQFSPERVIFHNASCIQLRKLATTATPASESEEALQA